MQIHSVSVHQLTSSMKTEAEEDSEEEAAVEEEAEVATTITIATKMEARTEVAITIPQEMEGTTITSSIEEEEEAITKAMVTRTTKAEKVASQLEKAEAEEAFNLEVATT